MNIYDTKSIYCSRCNVSIGEIDYDAEVIRPLCGKCANPLPEGDKIIYTMSHFQNNSPMEKSILA
ncbi:hypothetical protein [Nitrosopumilus sp. S4]